MFVGYSIVQSISQVMSTRCCGRRRKAPQCLYHSSTTL